MAEDEVVPGTTENGPDVDLACDSTSEPASGGALLLAIVAAGIQMRTKGRSRR